jgi:hypothetical protein
MATRDDDASAPAEEAGASPLPGGEYCGIEAELVSGVAVAIVATDLEDGREFDVVGQDLAELIVARLLGPGRQVEPVGGEGAALGWLVSFTRSEFEELTSNGFFGREDDRASIEAEWPSGASPGFLP